MNDWHSNPIKLKTLVNQLKFSLFFPWSVHLSPSLIIYCVIFLKS